MIIALIVLFVIIIILVFSRLEKRSMNKHKKLQNYKPKHAKKSINIGEQEQDELNKNDKMILK